MRPFAMTDPVRLVCGACGARGSTISRLAAKFTTGGCSRCEKAGRKPDVRVVAKPEGEPRTPLEVLGWADPQPDPRPLLAALKLRLVPGGKL